MIFTDNKTYMAELRKLNDTDRVFTMFINELFSKKGYNSNFDSTLYSYFNAFNLSAIGLGEDCIFHLFGKEFVGIKRFTKYINSRADRIKTKKIDFFIGKNTDDAYAHFYIYTR